MVDTAESLAKIDTALRKMKDEFNAQYVAMASDNQAFHNTMIELSSKYPEHKELVQFIVLVNDKLETNHQNYSDLVSDAFNELIDIKLQLIDSINRKIKAEKIRAEKIKAEKIKAEKIRAEKIRAEKIRAEKIKAKTKTKESATENKKGVIKKSFIATKFFSDINTIFVSITAIIFTLLAFFAPDMLPAVVKALTNVLSSFKALAGVLS